MSRNHMPKIKALAHVTTSNFCKGKPYPVPKIDSFWDVIPWSLAKMCWHFRGPCCLQHYNREHSLPICSDDGCSRFLCNVTHYTSNRLHRFTSHNTVLLKPQTSWPNWTHKTQVTLWVKYRTTKIQGILLGPRNFLYVKVFLYIPAVLNTCNWTALAFQVCIYLGQQQRHKAVRPLPLTVKLKFTEGLQAKWDSKSWWETGILHTHLTICSK